MISLLTSGPGRSRPSLIQASGVPTHLCGNSLHLGHVLLCGHFSSMGSGHIQQVSKTVLMRDDRAEERHRPPCQALTQRMSVQSQKLLQSDKITQCQAKFSFLWCECVYLCGCVCVLGCLKYLCIFHCCFP